MKEGRRVPRTPHDIYAFSSTKYYVQLLYVEYHTCAASNVARASARRGDSIDGAADPPAFIVSFDGDSGVPDAVDASAAVSMRRVFQAYSVPLTE